MRWETVEIGKVSKVISGFAFKSKDFQPVGIPIIKIKSIKDENIVLDENDCVDSAIEVPKRFHLSKGDIIISLTGSHITLPSSVVGRVAKYRHETNSYLNQRAGKFINIDIDRCHKDYLFYFLLQKEILTKIANKAQGAANQANISPGDVEGVEINLPPLPTQRKIASILSAYDDLIENNLKRIKLLEEKAQLHYKELISINRCDKIALKELVNVEWGDTNVTKSSYVKIGYKAFSASGPDGFTDYFDFDCPGIVVSAIGAYCGKIWFTLGKWTAIKNTMTLTSNSDVPLEFIFQSLNNPDVWHKRGAAQPFLSKSDTMDINVLIPKIDLKNYGSMARNVYEFKEALENQNTKLREARDILLPRLMNGQIEV